MAEITWSKLALDDLDTIHDYIAKESPFYAQKTIEEFIERVSVLATHPEIGHEVPEYVRKDVRELNEGNYRIFTIRLYAKCRTVSTNYEKQIPNYSIVSFKFSFWTAV